MRRVFLTVVLCLALNGCATFGGSYPLVGVVQQRTSYDCAVASLAMLLRVTYDDLDPYVDHELLREQGGYSALDVIATAARMGRTLRSTEQFDPRKDVGLLMIKWPWGQLHMVFIAHGWVYDPIGSGVQETWLDYNALREFEWRRPVPCSAGKTQCPLLIYEVGFHDPL